MFFNEISDVIITFKGFFFFFLRNSLENRRSSENQSPEKIARKVDFFLSLAFYNAPSLDIVEKAKVPSLLSNTA